MDSLLELINDSSRSAESKLCAASDQGALKIVNQLISENDSIDLNRQEQF